MYQFHAVATDAESLKQSSALLRATFPGVNKFSPDFLRWQYEDNPDGKVVGFEARDGQGVVAAHYVTIPMTAKIDGKIERGLLSLNTATNPRHQRKGLFVKLAAKTYEAGQRAGYAFVVAVANANSSHGFIKKLGFQLVSQLEAKVGLGKPRIEAGAAASYQRWWTRESIKWRLSNPSAVYRAHRGEVLATTGLRFLSALLDHNRDELPEFASREHIWFSPVRIWLGLEPGAVWRKSGFIDVPKRLRTSPLNLIFLDLSGKSRSLKASTVRFRALDFDAY